MRLTFRPTVRLFLIGLMLAGLLSGCAPPEFSRGDVNAYLREEFPDAAFTVSWNHMDVEISQGRKVRTWEVRFNDAPELPFHVYSMGGVFVMFYNSSASRWLTNDMNNVFLPHYLERYGSRGGDLSRWMPPSSDLLTFPMLERYSCFTAVYGTRREARAVRAQAVRFADYIAGQPHPCRLLFDAHMERPYGLLPGDAGHGNFSENAASELYTEYALLVYNAYYLPDDTDFTPEELADWNDAYYGGERPAAVLPNGTEVDWTGLAVCESPVTNECNISFAALYKLLERGGLSPIGTPQDFSITGSDGQTYSFSYSFFEEDSGGERTFYYLADGGQVRLRSASGASVNIRRLLISDYHIPDPPSE